MGRRKKSNMERGTQDTLKNGRQQALVTEVKEWEISMTFMSQQRSELIWEL